MPPAMIMYAVSLIIVLLLAAVNLAQSQNLCSESECEANLTSPLLQANCKCDNDCELYNDCCLNYTPTSPAQPSYLHELLECQAKRVTINKLDSSFLISVHVLVVSRCSSEMNNSQCSNQSLFLPVTDPRSNITFRNIYCALCNNISQEEAVLWQPRFLCRDINAVSSLTTYGAVQNECKLLRISTDLSIPQIRTCTPHISTCPNTSSLELEHNCTNGPLDLVTDPLAVVGPASVYRNHYCAQCNGVTDTLCWNKLFAIFYNADSKHCKQAII